MTAAYLSKALDGGVNISLIESPTISTIGVGEATFSTIKLFFDALGLREHEWMPQCNASYKLAIKFVDWNAEGRHFYHPFQRYEIVDGFNIAEWWLKLKSKQEPFDYACFIVPALCDRKKSPMFMDGRVFDSKVEEHLSPNRPLLKNMLVDLRIQFPYAYHFNASLLANFLRDFSIAKGIKQILDEVVNVRLADDGSIAAVTTKEHSDLRADLFIDCSGFRGLLINKALKEPFITFGDSLPCDSAIAMQIPRDISSDGINPYTTATALGAGWVWNIPLYGRDGTGYVYSSAFASQEEAESEFRKHLGSAADNREPLHIRMRVGRNRNSWVKNCVAIGLSSGFVEPLESTGIFFIQNGIEELVSHFPSLDFDPEMIRSFNRSVADCIDGVRDFLVLHYYASTRADTAFWRATKQELAIPDSLVERLRLWKTCLPNNRTINPRFHGFEAYSYSCMLLGLGYRPKGNTAFLDHLGDQNALAAFRSIRQRCAQLCESLPSQYEYLSAMSRSSKNGEEGASTGSPT
jgi:hypothetical protein